MVAAAETRYAKSGDLNIAYQVSGGGPFDLVFVPGYVTHLELHWDMPSFVPVLERLGSFSRLIRFDKRGTGMSDRVSGAPTLESRMDDVRAVMDAVGSRARRVLRVVRGRGDGTPVRCHVSRTARRRSSCAARFRAGCGHRTIRGAGRRRSTSVRSPGRSRSLVRASERWRRLRSSAGSRTTRQSRFSGSCATGRAPARWRRCTG